MCFHRHTASAISLSSKCIQTIKKRKQLNHFFFLAHNLFPFCYITNNVIEFHPVKSSSHSGQITLNEICTHNEQEKRRRKKRMEREKKYRNKRHKSSEFVSFFLFARAKQIEHTRTHKTHCCLFVFAVEIFFYIFTTRLVPEERRKKKNCIQISKSKIVKERKQIKWMFADLRKYSVNTLQTEKERTNRKKRIHCHTMYNNHVIISLLCIIGFYLWTEMIKIKHFNPFRK